MKMTPAGVGRVFGVGMLGLLISMTLLSVAVWLNKPFNLPPLRRTRAF
jgi:hypothetical protein